MLIEKLGFKEQNCPIINILNSHKKKNILDEKCLIIAISFYLFISILYAKILYVNWA
jgi:hypothetical protein